MKTVATVMTLIVAAGLMSRRRTSLPRSKPLEGFEALMKAVDAALVADSSNPYARFLHVGLGRCSIEAIRRQDFNGRPNCVSRRWPNWIRRSLAKENEKIIGSRAALLISVSLQMPNGIERPFLPSVTTDFQKVLRTWDAGGRQRSVHERGELLTAISHFYSKDGLTFASTGTKDVIVDTTMRVHRAAMVNLTFVDEVSRGFAGGLSVRLNDAMRTSLPVARDRVRCLKARMGF